MSQQLVYNKGTTLGGEISSLVGALQGSIMLIRRITDQVNCVTYGSPADYTALATMLGMSVQDATEIVFLLAAIKTQLDTAPITGTTGITRLDF